MKNYYIEKLKLDSNQILERNQMKKIKDGRKHNCRCIGSVGA
ncbi:MAG: hypothetical protein HLUCCX10_08755 [Algoriphagus marincola HL-49]|uniref:Uncharacterized protein n=1 Tax=Algoriphagus marincola HL-49 TaxID=1305737 RepID=A0A0P7Y688_9BACT|nr:MAG: hypothetical protein HLUCCX10_08755 [Algoriphagus marincola HL-49]